VTGWPGHGPNCKLYDQSAGHEAAVISHVRNCLLPLRLLAELPRELRFEVPIELARDAARIGWVAALAADRPDWLPGETTGERDLARARRVLAGRIDRTASPGDLWPGEL